MFTPLLLLGITFTARGASFTVGDFRYSTESETTVKVTGHVDENLVSGDLVIPSAVMYN